MDIGIISRLGGIIDRCGRAVLEAPAEIATAAVEVLDIAACSVRKRNAE